MCCSVVIGLVLLAAYQPAAGAPQVGNEPRVWLQGVTAGGAMLASVPDVGRAVSRFKTRMEHSGERFGDALGEAGVLWFWILLSVIEFFVVAALASVIDRRMFGLRRQGRGALSRYLAYGIRTFFRVLRDRHTPLLARLIIVGALLYWVLPMDLIPDHSIAPGLLDDLLVAIAAAKSFIRLCPDTLVAKHAAEVQAQAHA